MNGPVRRLSIGLFAGFFALLLAVTWIQVIHADVLKADPRNSRPALSERGKERGLIVTIDGTVVAQSVPIPKTPLVHPPVSRGAPFAHVVGYNSFLVGSSGLENAYADELRSRRDLTISDLVSVILGRDLRPESLELTINADLQRAAYEGLGGLKGGVFAIDPRTGAVLASVSSPSYDPESLLGGDAAEVWESLLADPDGPLLDRATREIYPPGSTFKTVVTAAALDTGTAVPETEFPTPRSLSCLARRRRSPTRAEASATTAGRSPCFRHSSSPATRPCRPLHPGGRRGHRDHSRGARLQRRDSLPVDGARGDLPGRPARQTLLPWHRAASGTRCARRAVAYGDGGGGDRQ